MKFGNREKFFDSFFLMKPFPNGEWRIEGWFMECGHYESSLETFDKKSDAKKRFREVKRILRRANKLFLLLTLLLSGCMGFEPFGADVSRYDSYVLDISKVREEYQVEVFCLEELESDDALASFVCSLIEYEDDGFEWWKSPEETLSDKAGDCEDYAILFIAMARSLGFTNDYELVSIRDAYGKHAVVENMGTGCLISMGGWYETFDSWESYGWSREINRYSYAEIMYQAHEKVLFHLNV